MSKYHHTIKKRHFNLIKQHPFYFNIKKIENKNDIKIIQDNNKTRQ